MISTKKGDDGKTYTVDGERVFKDDIRIEFYGELDELISFLGFVKHEIRDEEGTILEDIQRNLFRIFGNLSKSNVKKLEKEHVERITELVERYEKKVNISGFVLPGSTRTSALLDICRAIARRVERRFVTLSREKKADDVVLAYLNRLSDLFFVMARYLEKEGIKRVEDSERS